MNALTQTRTRSPLATFTNVEVFDQLWRGAQALSSSQLVPATFRDKPQDCFIALHMASRLGCDPLLLLQNMYIVHGTPAFSAKFAIAQANQSGAFKGRIRFRPEGKGEALSVTAYATLADTGETVEATVDMAMAKAEGWTKNPKYKSMPEHMLTYRAATFLVRRYCPEALLGLPTADEAEDIHVTATVVPDKPVSDLNALLEQSAEPEKVAELAAPEQKTVDVMWDQEWAISTLKGAQDVETIDDILDTCPAELREDLAPHAEAARERLG